MGRKKQKKSLSHIFPKYIYHHIFKGPMNLVCIAIHDVRYWVEKVIRFFFDYMSCHGTYIRW